ncbi:MAG TPA: hypothetical protein VGL56_14795 [Fimbriimonadaceae bacterium]|jgi:hypothetical protein
MPQAYLKDMASKDPKSEKAPELHGPLSDEMISPEDVNDPTNQIEPPDELDAYGNSLEHEGKWAQDKENTLSDEDSAETRDWNNAPVDPAPEGGWINKKESDSN